MPLLTFAVLSKSLGVKIGVQIATSKDSKSYCDMRKLKFWLCNI